MSRTIWGTPLVGSAAAADPMSDASLIADLNNWTKQNFSSPVNISYDPATRTNTFSYNMIQGDFERMYYKFKVEPNTHYIFALKLAGNFTEDNTTDGKPHQFNILVTREPINQNVFTDTLAPSSSEEDGIVINSYAYSRLDFNRKRDFGLPFFTYKQSYADGDPRNDEEPAEDDPTGEELAGDEQTGNDYAYLYIDFSVVTDGKVADFVFKDVRCVTWDPGLFYLTGPIVASNEPGDVWHIIASYPGAWIWAFVDNTNHTQHIFALSGDPFKLIDVATDYNTGYLSTSYKSSEPVVIDGRTYHKAHMKIIDIEGSDIIAHLMEKEYTDDVIYTKLSEYVREKEPYNFIEVLDDDHLHTWLGGYNFASMFGLTEEEFSYIMNFDTMSASRDSDGLTTFNIHYPPGYTCTATDGTNTYTAPDTSGAWTLVGLYDSLTVVAVNTNGDESITRTVQPESGTTVSVHLYDGRFIWHPYSIYTQDGLSSSDWEDTTGTKHITLDQGEWVVTDNKLVANGSCFSFQVPSSSILIGWKGTISSGWTPNSNGNWYQASCLFGHELGGSQKDFACIIRPGIIPSIGYSTSSIQNGSISLTPDTEYTIFLLHTGSAYYLWVDGSLAASVSYTASGDALNTMGLFWNAYNAGNSRVKGTCSKLGVWTFDEVSRAEQIKLPAF